MKTLQDFKDYLDAVVWLGQQQEVCFKNMNARRSFTSESMVEEVRRIKEERNAAPKAK